MSLNVVAAVMQVLQPELVTKIAAALGIDRAAAMKAVSATVPAILGGFSRKAASTNGAAEINDILEKQDAAFLGQLGGALGGSGQDALIKLGLGMIERLFGGAGKEALIAALGKYTGIDPQKLADLVAVIAPIVTSILASYQKSAAGAQSTVASLLVTQGPAIERALPSRFVPLLVAAPMAEAVAAPKPREIVSGAAAAGMATATAIAAASSLVRAATGDAAAKADTVAPNATAALKAVAAKAAPVADVAPKVREAVAQIAAGAIVREVAVAAPGAHGSVDVPPKAAGTVANVVPARPAVGAPTPIGGQAPVATPKVGPAPTGNPTPAAVRIETPKAPMPVAPPPQVGAEAKPKPTERPEPRPRAAASSEGRELVPVEPIRERRRRLPVAAWLLPLLVLIGAGGWWVQSSMDSQRIAIAAEQAKRLAEQKSAAEARLKAEADAALAKVAAEADRKRKEAAEAAAMKAAADAEAERKRKAEAEAAAMKIAADAEAERKRKAEADAAAMKVAADAEAERKRKAEAEAAAMKIAADAEAERKRKAEADAAAKAAAVAEANRVAAAKRTAEARPTVGATTETGRAIVSACQKAVRDAATMTAVQFEFASASIHDTAALSKVAASLKKCPDVHVRIEGHTDSNGDIHRNQRLSETRASTVATFLLDAGVAANQVTSKGFGETKPLVMNDTESNRARNRRIEIIVE